jgi:hypothetical protein
MFIMSAGLKRQDREILSNAICNMVVAVPWSHLSDYCYRCYWDPTPDSILLQMHLSLITSEFYFYFVRKKHAVLIGDDIVVRPYAVNIETFIYYINTRVKGKLLNFLILLESKCHQWIRSYTLISCERLRMGAVASLHHRHRLVLWNNGNEYKACVIFFICDHWERRSVLFLSIIWCKS